MQYRSACARFITLKWYPQNPSSLLQIAEFLSLNWNDIPFLVLFPTWRLSENDRHSAEKMLFILSFPLSPPKRHVAMLYGSAGNCSGAPAPSQLLIFRVSSQLLTSPECGMLSFCSGVPGVQDAFLSLHFLTLLRGPIGNRGALGDAEEPL